MGKTYFTAVRLLVPISCLVACGPSTQSLPSSPDNNALAPAIRDAMKSLPNPGPPGLLGGTAWDCPFPKAADAARIDQAVASVAVSINPNGQPEWVKIIADPGYNFGITAALCAMRRPFVPARNAEGIPIWAMTPPINVRFTR